jgi:hypothetical protein
MKIVKISQQSVVNSPPEPLSVFTHPPSPSLQAERGCPVHRLIENNLNSMRGESH